MGYQKIDGRWMKKLSGQKATRSYSFEEDFATRDDDDDDDVDEGVMMRIRHLTLMDLPLERPQDSQPVRGLLRD